MKKSTRLISFCAINGIAALLTYFAFIEGSRGADNVLCLALWWQAFGGLMMIIGSGMDSMQNLKENGRSVPAWVSHGIGILFIATFAWFGSFTYAILMMFAEFAEAIFFHKDEPQTIDEE